MAHISHISQGHSEAMMYGWSSFLVGKANSESMVSALTFPLHKFLPNVLFPVALPAVAV